MARPGSLIGSRPGVRGVPVDDPDDPRVAVFGHLKDAALRRRVDAGRAVFVVEGLTAIRALLASSYEVDRILVADKRLAALAEALAGRPGVEVLVAGQAVLDAISGFHLHRGALATGVRPAPVPAGALVEQARRVVVLEALNDHENLGVVFRNAAALGIDSVLLSPTCCDPLYRRSIRVSTGQVLRVPFATLDPWPDGIDLLRNRGFTVVALTPDPGATPLGALDPATERLAFLLGAEGPGLTGEAMAAADHRVRIEMLPGVDSLNVATAAAIAFHHAAPYRAR